MRSTPEGGEALCNVGELGVGSRDPREETTGLDHVARTVVQVCNDVPLAEMKLGGLRDVEGTALPTFRLVGPLNQPGGVTFAGGEITAKFISLTHPSLPERLTALQGKFVLAEGGTRFEQVTGHIGDTDVLVQGAITEIGRAHV